MKPIYIISEIEQVQALSSPLRLRIIEQLLESKTAKQVALALEEPPTKLYHHFNALREAGLIKLLEVRPNRGTWEKYYQAVARRFMVDDQLFNFGEKQKPTGSKDRLHQIEDQLGELLEDIRLSYRQGWPENPTSGKPSELLFRKAILRQSPEKTQQLRKAIVEAIEEGEVRGEGAERKEVELFVALFPNA